MSDVGRLPDPTGLFNQLPKGTAIVLRHTDPKALAQLARHVLPRARAYHLKVLISNDVRLARQLGADGVHLSEAIFRSGHWRRTITSAPPNFILTVAHHRLSPTHVTDVDAILMSPVFITESHPDVRPLGLLRFASVVRQSPLPIIALGGITTKNVKRLKLSRTYGVAAIGAWDSKRP